MCQDIGVRPSPGAAMWTARKSPGCSTSCLCPKVAVPEDGHTPSKRQTQPLVSVSKPRTAPRPFLRQRNQPCLCGIALDVASSPTFVIAVSHKGVPVAILPELSLAPEDLVGLLRRVALPRVHQLAHRHVLHLKEHMNMIGHDHPRPEIVLNGVTKPQRVLDQLRNVGTPQVTFATSFVQISLQFKHPLAILLNPQQRLPLAPQFFRKCIRKSERHELDQPRFVAMRQITVLVPATKPTLHVFRGERMRPLTLAAHQVTNAGIIGRAGQALGSHAGNQNRENMRLTRPESANSRKNPGVRPSSGAATWIAPKLAFFIEVHLHPTECARPRAQQRSQPASPQKTHTPLPFQHCCARGRAHSALSS
jgi:hypothetical protein